MGVGRPCSIASTLAHRTDAGFRPLVVDIRPLGMSSNPVAHAESAGLSIGVEPSLGVSPTVFQTLQPNAGGIKGFYLKTKKVQRQPLSKFGQNEAPQVVDADAMPVFTADLTKDLQDALLNYWMMSAIKHTGGTGQAYFQPTARTSTDYTVAANGALQAGTLWYARGFVNAANNGLFVVGASSTGTAVKVSGGVAETVSGYNATGEVAGFQGASGDITLDVNGNLTSTVADFTTMGLLPGMRIFVGDGAGTAFSFANAAYRGSASILGPVTAHLIPLSRRDWTVGSADTGTGKTIRLLWGRWARTVATSDPDYNDSASVQFELSLPKASAGTDAYVYARGNIVDQTKFSGPAQGLITCETTFVGTTIDIPTTTRTSGASAAFNPLATSAYSNSTGVFTIRLANKATEAVVSDDIDTWDITYMNHAQGQKQAGTLGNKRTVVGRKEAQLTANAFLTQTDAIAACQNNTFLTLGVGLRNPDGGIFFDVPSCTCDDTDEGFPQNGPVTLALKLSAFRDATLNMTLGISVWPYLPQS